MSTSRRRDSYEDPSRTLTLQREYAQHLRAPFGELISVIRRRIGQDDIFGLELFSGNIEDPPVFRFESDPDKQDEFLDWLETQEEEEILTTIDRNNNQYVRHSYSRGLDFADEMLRQEGITIPAGMDNPFDTPVHQDELQRLYTRNYEELQGITSAMRQEISRELTDGFAAGLGPEEMAANLSDRVDKVGRHRATTLARTEVIQAHSDATLNRYEEMGITNVTVQAEFRTAGDRRVCPVCSALEGQTRDQPMTIDETRNETFTFNPSDSSIPDSLRGEFRKQPPLHPNCRCVILPVT